MELLVQIMEVVIIPLLGVLTTYIVKLVNTKINEISDKRKNELEKKYLNMLGETITDCVIATSQTYVDSLKQKGEFTPEAQKEAFELEAQLVNLEFVKRKDTYNAAIGGNGGRPGGRGIDRSV